MARIGGWLLVCWLATGVGWAHAGGFSGFGPGGRVLDDDTRVCEPLIVGPDRVAVGTARCRPVAPAERAAFKRTPMAPPTWAARARKRVLTVTRAGRDVATWTASVELEGVVGVYVAAGAEIIAVEVKARNGRLLVPLRLTGTPEPIPVAAPPAGRPAAPGSVPGGSDAGPPDADGQALPMDIAAGTWRQAAVSCERAGVTLDLTAARYRLVIETRCQSTRDRLTLSGEVRPGASSPIELVLENEDGPADAWPCTPRPCASGLCLACSDGEDGFELVRDATPTPRSSKRRPPKGRKGGSQGKAKAGAIERPGAVSK